MTDAKPNGNGYRKYMGLLGRGLAGGAGVVIAVYVLDQLQAQGMVEVLKAWGAPFGIGLAFLFILDRRGGQLVKVNAELTGAIKQQSGAIAGMMGAQTRENQLVIDSLAENFSGLMELSRTTREEVKILAAEIGELKKAVQG